MKLDQLKFKWFLVSYAFCVVFQTVLDLDLAQAASKLRSVYDIELSEFSVLASERTNDPVDFSSPKAKYCFSSDIFSTRFHSIDLNDPVETQHNFTVGELEKALVGFPYSQTQKFHFIPSHKGLLN